MATTSFPLPATSEQLADMSRELVALGARLEKKGGSDWFLVARAAALVDGLCHAQVSPQGGGHGAAR